MSKISLKKVPGAWYLKILFYIWNDSICYASFAAVLFFKDIFHSAPVPNFEKVEKRTGQVAVVIGSPRGLAVGMVKRLVQLDYTIIMGVRSIEDSKRRLYKIAEENASLDFGKVSFLKLDLTSLQTVKKFAVCVLSQVNRIDLLLCNGAVFLAPYELTVDGYESQFQVNYLSHFFVTQLFLDRLKKTGEMKGQPTQIIYSSSCVYNWAKFDPNELENPTVYTKAKCYFPTKLYPIMSMLYLQNKLNEEGSQVSLYAVHPGIIATDILQNMPFWTRIMMPIMSSFFRTVQNGADTILWPALAPEYLFWGGIYMESGKPVELKGDWAEKDKLELLYRRSLQLVGMDER